MKNGILIASSLVIGISAQGMAGIISDMADTSLMSPTAGPSVVRDVLPLFEVGKSWHCRIMDGPATDRPLGHESWTVTGKSDVEGREIWNVLYSNDVSGKTYTLTFYEENGRVFSYEDNAGREIALLYDFNYNKGDVVYMSSQFISDKDRITVHGIDRNRMVITRTGNEQRSVWIEGIGAFGSASLTLFPVPNCDPDGPVSRFENCCLDGEIIFSYDDLQAESTGEPDITFVPSQTGGSVTLLENGKSWIIEKYGLGSDIPVGKFEVTVVGDAVINGIDCRHLKCTDTAVGEVSDLYAYEDDGRVYLYYEPTGGFALMMDFGYTPYTFVGSYDWAVTDADMVNAAGADRKRLVIKRLRHTPVDTWVEGIGSAHGAFISSLYGPEWEYRLSECYLNGNVIFRYEDFDRKPGSIESIPDESGYDDDAIMTDISGRRIITPVKGNIYIKGRRKIIY